MSLMRPIRCRDYFYPFTDYANQPATVVFSNHADSTLPPLASFAIYFVNASTPVPLSTDSAIRLLQTISESGLIDAKPFRLELFHLPAADIDLCMQHHIAERAARGDYTPQLEAVRHDQKPKEPEEVSSEDFFHTSVRPGLPSSYRESYEHNYHQLFFVCHSASWDSGDGMLELVEYDPIAPEQFAEDNLEPEEYAKDPALAALPARKAGTYQAISTSHFGLGDRDANGKTIMEMNDTIRFRSHFEGYDEGIEGLFQEARRKGWMHW